MSNRLLTRLVAPIAALALSLFGGAPALADITIDVNQAAVQPLPIAIPPFTGTAQGAQISQVVTADLQRSGLFRPLDPAIFRAKPPEVGNVPDSFDPWKAIGAQALVIGRVSTGADGRLVVDSELFDVYAGEELGIDASGKTGVRLTATPDSWRRIAHQIADAIYQKLTGEPGYFDTRVVFVAESGPKTKRTTRLEMVDQDGANGQYLNLGLPEGGLVGVYAPRFSPRRQQIAYTVLRPTGTTAYLMDTETGRSEVLVRMPGNMTTPRFSPDDTKVAFAADRNGVTNIWLMDLASHAMRRVTNGLSIDTSPSFSPNGSQIVFNSDRGGTPQLYVMNADGSGAHRISFGAGRYNAPVWSPDGKLIAFVKQEGGQFSLGVMNPDGSGEHILCSSYFDDQPTWAPNGRVIMFERKTGEGGSRLWMVDVTGRVLQEAPYPGNGSDPAWSPLLH